MSSEDVELPAGFEHYSVGRRFLWGVAELGKMVRNRMIKISMVLVSVAVSFLLIELGFRLVGLMYGIDFRLYMKELTNSNRLPQGLIAEDERMKIKLVPNTQVLAETADFSVVYLVNSKGLRDVEYDYKKPEGVQRILAFGDSFTFGEGIPYGQRFTEVIEDNLESTEVLNFGIPGLGIDQALMYYYLEGRKYEADTVILFANLLDAKRARLGLTISGKVDLSTIAAESFSHDVDTMYLRRDDPLYKQEVSPLLQPFYSYGYLRYRWTVWQLREAMKTADQQGWQTIAATEGDFVDDIEQTVLIDRTALLVEALAKLVQEHGQRFILINIDTPKEFKYWEKVTEAVEVVDLSEELAEFSQHETLTFTYDQHYNAKTHELIGMKVAEYWRDR